MRVFWTLLLLQMATLTHALAALDLATKPKTSSLVGLVLYRAETGRACSIQPKEDPAAIPLPYRQLPLSPSTPTKVVDPQGNVVPPCVAEDLQYAKELAAHSTELGPRFALDAISWVAIGLGVYYVSCTASYVNRMDAIDGYYRAIDVDDRPLNSDESYAASNYAGEYGRSWASGFLCAPATAINDILFGIFN